MSQKPFEAFLVERLIQYADVVRPGCRYIFRCTNPDHLNRLVAALRDAAQEVYTTGNGVELRAIKAPSAKLIIAGQAAVPNPGEGVFSDNFVAWLRDAVAEQVELPDAALIIIHNSQLDTLLSSADDLGASVWSTQSVRDALTTLIGRDEPARTVSHFLLRKTCEETEAEGSSVFSYEPLYRSLDDGKLEFHELRMFKDSAFQTNKNPRQLEQRYNENRRLYEKVAAAIEHSPDAIAERLSDEFRTTFTNDRIVAQLPNDWRNVEFEELLKEQQSAKEMTFVLRAVRSLFEGDKIHYRHEAESGARNRRVHVLLERSGAAASECRLEFSALPQPGGALYGRTRAPGVDVRLDGRRAVVVSINTTGVAYFSLKVRSKSDTSWDFFFVIVPRGVFHLAELQNRFLVRPPVRDEEPHIELQGTQKSLAVNANVATSFLLDALEKQGAEVDVESFGRVEYAELFDRVEVLEFSLRSGPHVLRLRAAGESERVRMRLPVLLDERRGPHLFRDEYAGTWARPVAGAGDADATGGKVSLGNREYPVTAEEGRFLDLEERIVSGRTLVFDERTHHRHVSEAHGTFGDAYSKLLEYFHERHTLPSLCGWPASLRALVVGVVDAFREVARSVQSGERLTEAQRDIVLAGTVITARGERYLSPFSPLALAYFAELSDQAEQDLRDGRSFFSLPTVTRSRFTPRGLLPYVRLSSSQFGYVRPLTGVNPMWLAISDDASSLRSYVPALTSEKIEQFVSSFRTLFEGLAGATLYVNSVHNGDNDEVFNGIARYASRNGDSSLRIHVNVIGDPLELTAFERFSEMTNAEEIRKTYSWTTNREVAEQAVNFLRKNLTFSRIRTDASRPYAHLTLLRAVSSSTPRSHDLHRQPTSAGAGGLISGETSRVDNDAYVSGVGISATQERDSRLLGVAAALNRLFFPAVEPHESVNPVGAMALSIEPSMREDLRAAYASSVWTTVIDPRVTLAFFETEPDTLLIHYSDQYTVSAAYDAITLTTRRDLYGAATGTQSTSAIRELNAFNGEWLLRLITDTKSNRKGRRGVVAAYKLLWHVLPSEAQTVWVPLSMEEWVRVAGNVGLPKEGEDFARLSHAGALSDDVLFAGFGPRGVELVALEVKTTGHRPDFAKARAQSTALLKHMLGLLRQRGLGGRVFRALFVRQVLLQIEKYNLYRIFPDGYFAPVVDNDEGWLSGDFDVVRSEKFPSRVVLAHIEENCWQTSVVLDDGVVQIEVPGGQLDHLLETPLADIKAESFGLSRQHVIGVWEQGGGDAVLDEALEPQGPAESSEEVEVVSEPVPSATASTSGGTATSAEEVATRSVPQVETSAAAVAVDAPSTPAPAPIPMSSGPLTVRFGTDVSSGRPIDWHPTDTTRVFNANTGIIGTMGTGKTQFTKSVITQLVRNQHSNVGGAPIGVLILDYKADYIKPDFVAATGAQVYSLHHLPINPLALYGDIPMLPMHTASAFRTTLSKAFGLGTKQQNRIKNLVLDCYSAAGIIATDSSTWIRRAPTLADVWARFNAAEKLEEDSLYAALDSLTSFEIFEPDAAKTMNLLEVANGVTVINLSGYDVKVQNLVVAVILDLLYTQMHQRGSSALEGQYRQLRNIVLVDEADNFMSQGFESLKKLLKEGREFGVATILSTQELTHFRAAEDDYAKYILTWIVHRVGDIQGADVRAIFNAEAKGDVDALLRQIRELAKHESLYRDSEKKIRKIRDLAFWELIQPPSS